mgnify:CR=1 FL=1
MRKKLILFVCIILSFNFMFAIGFNTVKNNQIDMSDYNFDDFNKEFNIGMRFLCVDTNVWNTNIKDTYEVTDKDVLNETVKLQLRVGNTLKPDYFIEVTPKTLKEFRKSFIQRNCLTFENGFPVKVLKVKTAVGDEIKFFSRPGGKERIYSRASENVIYYPFKQRILKNGEKWLYLCNSKVIDLGVRKDIENKTIGWVRYLNKNGEKLNVVLWNTNLGILPQYKESFEKYPLVFKRNANYQQIVNYYLNANPPNKDDLLADQQSVTAFIQRIEERNGNVDRWLPMYDSENHDPFTISVGVLDSMAIVKQSLLEVVTEEYMNLAILVDETLSMKRVWQKLDQVLIEILDHLSATKFKNLQKEEIKVKIRLYAYADQCRLINKDKWITSPEDVTDYSTHIRNITNNLINSVHFEPQLLNAVKYVINDDGIRNKPVQLIVIGDCGAYESDQSFKDELKEEATKQLLYDVSAVLFKSQPGVKSKKYIELYTGGHDRLKRNMEIVTEIDADFASEYEVKDLGKNIATDVISTIEATIYEFDRVIADGARKKERKPSKNISVFANRYLTELTEQLKRKGTSGTYFEEGKLYFRPSVMSEELFKSYVFIEKTELESFKSSLIEFINARGKQEFRNMLRDILATFFGENIHNIHDEFLRQTTIFELWEVIVGNKELAGKLMPDLFEIKDVDFYTLIERYNSDIEQNVLKNVTRIRNNLDRLQNEGQDKVEIVVHKGKTPEYKTYFWVKSEDINLFKGISSL